MIAIVDYGAGNLHSVKNALDYLHLDSGITSVAHEILTADGVILPGVGAFPDAMAKLRKAGLKDVLQKAAAQKPFLGICLGMQLLFETGYEFTPTGGLGILPGTVRPIPAPGLKIPHMGWNDLRFPRQCALTDGIAEGEYVYFVHSYRADCADELVAAYTVYGEKIPALVAKGRVWGAQFHPEKSGDIGLQILRNFGKQVAG